MLGSGAQRGWIAGSVVTEHHVEPVHALSLVGAGMYTLSLVANHTPVAVTHRRTVGMSTALTRWSRTIGALGGEDVWQRLIRLRVAVIGCGRSGSITALSLARLGLRHLTLIDPDMVELHNLNARGRCRP